MNKREFELLSSKTLGALRSVCPAARCVVVPSYASKETFGDLDVLVSLEGFSQDRVSQALGAVEVFRQKNATYCSMGVQLEQDGPVYQVDFLEEPLDSFDFALFYYAFNDLGNLLGILVSSQGLKLKHKGLYYYVKENTQVFAEVLVSRNVEEVLTFLGLSSQRYRQGFDSLEPLFDYVQGSRFFNPERYLLENRNHRSRTRDRKRPTYTAFLQYCRVNCKERDFPNLQPAGLDELCEHFEGLKDKLSKVFEELEFKSKGRSLLNGHLVRELTGLTGGQLGDFLKELRANQESSGLALALKGGDPAKVESVVKLEYQRLKAVKEYRADSQ